MVSALTPSLAGQLPHWPVVLTNIVVTLKPCGSLLAKAEFDALHACSQTRVFDIKVSVEHDHCHPHFKVGFNLQRQAISGNGREVQVAGFVVLVIF